MARDGWLFVGPAIVVICVGVLLWAKALHITGGILIIMGGISAMAFAFFFRDPDRVPPNDPNTIIATADGKIIVVAPYGDGATQIHTFLSVFDVHVNRAPVSGIVKESIHKPGRFELAWKDVAGTDNERHDLLIESIHGSVRSAQIAGILARRIICHPKVGDTLKQGERIGMIRFGSRAEVIAPEGFFATVKVGDHVRAGETIIARRNVQ